MKLILCDLDGTLINTKEINYRAYSKSMEMFGYSIDYAFFCEYCNGRHYTEFLSKIVSDINTIDEIHKKKTELYKTYLKYGEINEALVEIIKNSRGSCKVALVTTASRQNAIEALNEFNLQSLFDRIYSQEDIEYPKPNPEGFLKAMSFFDCPPNETVIFEDSDVGIEAAKKTGAMLFRVYGYN